MRKLAQASAVFFAALAALMMLAPTAPFTHELGVCESGAVRDVLAGNIILPHFIPGPMVHVPPLYWWTAALWVHALGWNELALRLPSIIAAAATCAIIFAWGATVLSRRAGLWAAVALLFCHFFLDAARQPRMDSMLALFVTAAAILLERAVARPDGGGVRVMRFALAACAIGLGALTKGILGILLPGLVIALYLVVRRRVRELFRFDLIATFAAGLAIGLAWYVAAYQAGGAQFLQWQLRMNLWSRFIPAEAGGAAYCVHPFWYFAPQTITGFLPWSVYLPALAVALWPRRGRTLPQPVLYALCWFAAIFLFFSASHGKCLVYILPAFPPLAMLTGWLIAQAREPASERTLLPRTFGAGTGAAAIAVLAIVAAAIILVVFGAPATLPLRLHPTDRRFLELFAAMAAARSLALGLWLAAWMLGGLAALAGMFRRNAALQIRAMAVIAAAGSLFWFGVMNPALAERETLAAFARQIAQTVPPSARIGHIGIEDCGIYFYSSRPIEPVSNFRCGAGAAFPAYIVIRKQRFDAMAPGQRACLTPILESASVDSNGPRILAARQPPPH